jgi:hypothetical protein
MIIKTLFEHYRKQNDDYYDSVDHFLSDLNKFLKNEYGDTDTITRSTVLIEKLTEKLSKEKEGFLPKE